MVLNVSQTGGANHEDPSTCPGVPTLPGLTDAGAVDPAEFGPCFVPPLCGGAVCGVPSGAGKSASPPTHGPHRRQRRAAVPVGPGGYLGTGFWGAGAGARYPHLVKGETLQLNQEETHTEGVVCHDMWQAYLAWPPFCLFPPI